MSERSPDNKVDTRQTGEHPRVAGIELLISNLLRAGVASSLSVVLLGIVISFMHHPDYMNSTAALDRLTEPGAAFPSTTAEVVEGLRHGRGQAIVMVGLMLLLATPVMRVAVSIVAFLYQGDRRFALITTVVFVLLLLSFVLGKAEG